MSVTDPLQQLVVRVPALERRRESLPWRLRGELRERIARAIYEFGAMPRRGRGGRGHNWDRLQTWDELNASERSPAYREADDLINAALVAFDNPERDD